MSLPAAPLAEADAHARAALARLDAGAHDLDAGRVVLLREALAELRKRLRTISNPPLRFLATVVWLGICLAAFSGAWLRIQLAAPWYVLLLIAVPIAAVWAGLFMAVVHRGRIVRGRRIAQVPVPEGDLPGHVDELTGILQGVGILAGKRAYVDLVHADACAARAWSLAHGGLAVGTREAEPGPERTSPPVASAIQSTVMQLHRLVHAVREEAVAADIPDPALHLLARYDTAEQRLNAAAVTLRGRRSVWRSPVLAFLCALYVVGGAAVMSEPQVFLLTMNPLIGVVVVGSIARARQSCANEGQALRKVPSLPAERRATLAAVEKHLTDVARLPGAAAAQAAEDLRVAREALAES